MQFYPWKPREIRLQIHFLSLLLLKCKPAFLQDCIKSVQTRGIVKTVVFTRGVFNKIGDFIKCTPWFSGGIPREQALLRKSKTLGKSPDKWIFLSLAFYNAPRLHTVDFIFLEYSML